MFVEGLTSHVLFLPSDETGQECGYANGGQLQLSNDCFDRFHCSGRRLALLVLETINLDTEYSFIIGESIKNILYLDLKRF